MYVSAQKERQTESLCWQMVISAGRRAVILSPELNKCIIFQYLPYLKTQIVGRTLEHLYSKSVSYTRSHLTAALHYL